MDVINTTFYFMNNTKNTTYFITFIPARSVTNCKWWVCGGSTTKNWEINDSNSITLILLLHALVNGANVTTSTSEAAGGDFFFRSIFTMLIYFILFIYFLGGEVHSESVMCRKFTEQIKKIKKEEDVCHVDDTALAQMVCHDITWSLGSA